MKRKLHWTLLALASLGGTASAEEPTGRPVPPPTDEDVSPSIERPQPAIGESLAIRDSGSRRGVAHDYLVLPRGAELTGAMRIITSQPVFNTEPVRFTDLALFTMAGRYSLFSKLEVSGSVSFLAKQPSDTDEKPWQSVGLGLRSPIGKRSALAISGAGGHLIDHRGMWSTQAIMLQWRKPIEEFLFFEVSTGLDGIGITAPRSTSAFITEISASGSAAFREKHWGAWLGLGYALPVHVTGTDPTTGLEIDPQPRLDFRVGTVFAIRQWDLFAEFAVIDRGDLSNPATRLPIMDGGFDQRQVVFGVTRHIDGKKRRRSDGYAMVQER